MRARCKKTLAMVMAVLMLLGCMPIEGLIGIKLPGIFTLSASAEENENVNETNGFTYTTDGKGVTITGHKPNVNDSLFYGIECNGHYYGLSTDSKSWEDAQRTCTENGGYLVSINDSSEQSAVENLLLFAPNGNRWIGAHKQNGTWQWTDGTSLDYTNWDPGEPNGNADTAIIYYGNNNSRDLHWDDCGGEFYYICEWDEEPAEGIFYECKNALIIPESIDGVDVTAIANSAFSGDKYIESIELPASVTSIGAYAFAGCIGLDGINLPKSLKAIGANAFNGCNGIKEIALPDTLESVGQYAFSGTEITEIVIPESVKTMGDKGGSYGSSYHRSALCGANKLTRVVFEEGRTSIPFGALRYCTQVTEVIIPEGVTSIDTYAISECSGLESVDLPSTLASISDYAFANCDGISIIEIPDSVTSIGSYAFVGCTGLTEVHYLGALEDWNDIIIAGGNEPLLNSNISFVHIHDFGDWYETKAPTCTERGVERHDCSRCDGYETRQIESLGHDYTDIVTKPNCTKKGYTTHNCIRCTYSYKDTYVDALGHDFGEWYQSKSPTCTEKGMERHDCSRCDGYETQQIDALGHDFCAWTVSKSATVLAEGSEQHVCNACKYTEERAIPRISIDPETDTDYGIAIFTVVNAQTLEPIAGAGIFVSTENDGEATFITDESGKTSITLPIGEQLVSVYADGCLTRNLNVKIDPGTNEIPAIGLSNRPTYNAKLESHLMSLEEIETAGIDLAADENQHVYRYELKLDFDPQIDWLSLAFYMGDTGVIKGDSSESSDVVWIEPTMDSAHGGHFYIREQDVSIYPVSEKFYIIVHGDVHWTKEIFDAELLVVNNSNTDTLEELTAKLELPEGLSLAIMQGEQQTAEQRIGNVPEGESRSVHWFIKGDVAGNYSFSASLKGKVMPFEEEIDDTFVVDSAINVWAGNAMNLHFEFPGAAYYDEDYPITITLTNVSDITLYNVSHLISGLKNGRITYYSDGSVEEEVYMEEGKIGSEFCREFKPGDKIVVELNIEILFESKLIEYQLEKLCQYVDSYELFLKGLNCYNTGLSIANAVKSSVSKANKALTLKENVLERLDSEKLNATKELYDSLNSLYLNYSTTGNKYVDSSAKLLSSGVDLALDMLSSDSANDFIKNTSPKDILKIASEINSFSKSLIPTEEDIRNFNLFDSIRTFISEIPICFVLRSVMINDSDPYNTTQIPWSYSVTDSGPHYFGVDSMADYMKKLALVGFGDIMDGIATNAFFFIPGADNAINTDGLKRDIIAIENQVKEFKARDTSHKKLFTAYIVKNDTENGQKSLKAGNAVGDFILACNDNETAVYNNGVLSFTGAGTIEVTPLSLSGGTLHIEDEQGNVFEYDISVVEPHVCSVGDYRTIIHPTEGMDGYAVGCCSVCGDIMDIITLTSSGCAHSFGNWTTVVEAACGVCGMRTRSCDHCGYEEIEYTDALEHDITLVNAKTATCEEDGYTGDKVCTICGKVLEQGTVIPPSGHVFGDWYVIKAASCATDGIEKRVCSCGTEESRSIPATGHNVEIRNAKEATCTEEGYTGDKVCTVCTETVDPGETVPALGHNYVNNKCTRCGDETQSSITVIVKLISSIVITVVSVISKLFSWR